MAIPIDPIASPKIGFEVLTPDEVRRIHEATLEVVETVGVRFPSERALDVWVAHGATVDRETQVVMAPRGLVMEALSHAPASYVLGARDPSQDLPLDGQHVYAATDGCGIEIVDIDTGELRRSRLQDVADIARIADALDEVGFIWTPLSAQDMPPESRSLHELAVQWRNTTKHLQTETIVTVPEALAAVEMATIVAGSEEARRARPPLSIMQCTTSPLGHDGGSLDASMIAAEAGIPTGFMTMASCAFSGPATLAGTLVVGNAEVITGLALMEIVAPGAPVFYAAAQTAMDLRSGAYTGGGPEDFLFGAATNALADFYRVPLSMGSFATGAKLPDWQAGVENSLSTFMASAVTSDMLLGIGLLNGSRIWSYTQMLLDAEIYSIVRKTLKGIDVSDEALALDAIREVGPNGDFLALKHTRAHMRELWQSRYMDRRMYGIWEKAEDRAPDWALARARAILRTHVPDPLDPAVSAELDRVVAGVERDHGADAAAAGAAVAAPGY
jgi:trimethylamine--corrinoid protein Co-methyltransferase